MVMNAVFRCRESDADVALWLTGAEDVAVLVESEGQRRLGLLAEHVDFDHALVALEDRQAHVFEQRFAGLKQDAAAFRTGMDLGECAHDVPHRKNPDPRSALKPTTRRRIGYENFAERAGPPDRKAESITTPATFCTPRRRNEQPLFFGP